MDPCPFVRIVIGNLALKFPTASKPTFSGVHPSSSPCYCKIKFKNFTSQTTTIPLILNEATHPEHPNSILQSASFTLPHSDIIKLSKSKSTPLLKIDVYKGKSGSTLGLSSGKLLGRVSIPLDLNCGLECKGAVFKNGWVAVGDGGGKAAQMYLSVKAEPDPRFVFEFGGEPECSPLVFQVQGCVKQPVFTCKFSLRDNNFRSRREGNGYCRRIDHDQIDEWMPDAVVEIVKNLKQAPLLMHVYDKGDNSSARLKTEKAVAEDWPAVKESWKEEAPEGVILVEEIQEEEEDEASKAWGIMIQGRGCEYGPSCYLLKTSRVRSGVGTACTHFCLTKVTSLRESALSQLTSCWLLQ